VIAREIFAFAAVRDLLCKIGGRLVSAGLSLSCLRLADDERQAPCGDNLKKYVVHLDSGSAIHCTIMLRPSVRLPLFEAGVPTGNRRADHH
jgi:hypothetical protein